MNTTPTRRPWRILFPVFVCLILAALLVAGFWPRPLPVQTARIVKGPLRVSVTEEGKTRIKSRFLVYPPAAGFLHRVELRAGTPVEAERTVLAVLTPEPAAFLNPRARAEAQSRIEAAEAAVGLRQAESRRMQASLDLARTELVRLDALLQTGAVARQEWDQAENQVRVLERSLQAAAFARQVAEHEAGAARAALTRAATPGREESVAILAPVDGFVLAVLEENARVVTPATAIMEVGDPRDLEIEIELLSSDAVAVTPGAEAVIEHWGGVGSLRATVTAVEPGGFTKVSAIGVEEQRVRVRAELADPLPAGVLLGDRYGVQARIVVWQGQEVLQVPTSALFRHEGQWRVFILEGGRAVLRTVGIGHDNGLTAEVRTGLDEGQAVILYPPDTLREGMAVRAEK